MLANMNEHGLGIARDMAKAVFYYEKAAKLNNPEALNNLGRLSETGKGMQVSLKDAHQFYKQAAMLGNLDATVKYGNTLLNGIGVEKNSKLAIEMFKNASDKGYAQGHVALGNLYYKGVGLDRDYFQAVAYFKLAADQGNATAMYNLGICYERGTGVIKDLTAAKQWYSHAAKLKHASATCSLACMYIYEQEYMSAINLLHLSVSMGCNDANYYLGLLFESGCQDQFGVILAQDLELAKRYYITAAEKGNYLSAWRLALVHLCGPEHVRDITVAVQYLELAAGKGISDAQNVLGEITELGYIDKNMVKAVGYYKMAVQNKHPRAMFNLASLYELGNGVEKDYEKAIRLYKEVFDCNLG
jgi:TPR repeat protein